VAPAKVRESSLKFTIVYFREKYHLPQEREVVEVRNSKNMLICYQLGRILLALTVIRGKMKEKFVLIL